MAKGDAFIKIDSEKAGLIKGEAKDAVHGQEIDVVGWSWTMDYPTDLRSGGRTGRVSMRSLVIHKTCDAASTALMSVLYNNDKIKTAVLSVRKGGGSPIDYLIITLKNAYITSYEIAQLDGRQPPIPTERFEMRFKEIDVRYAPQDEKGAKTGTNSFNAQVADA